MKDLQLTDLYNPQQIKSIATKHINITHDDNTAFQEWPGSIELWEKLPDGRLMRLGRWLKKSLIFVEYADNLNVWDCVRPYIKPQQ